MPVNSENHYNQTVRIVRDAIPRMSEMKTPITPENYAVWYEYLGNSNDKLRQEMDVLLNRDHPISNNEMLALYESYVENRNEKLNFAKTALSQIINTLHNHLQQADGHYGGFSRELNEITSNISEDTSSDDFIVLMERAIHATNTALQQGADMRGKLSSMATETEIIRSKLAHSQEEARTDALTGLNNRLAFQEELTELPKSLEDDSHIPCLLIIDIDHFKQVNDTYGHLAGDQVLAAIAQEIRASIRGRDMVARFGGEEFAVLIRDTPRSGCKVVAENIRSNIEQCSVDLINEEGKALTLSVTASVGGAWLRIKESTEEFIARADRNLYSSKENGRNKVTWETS